MADDGSKPQTARPEGSKPVSYGKDMKAKFHARLDVEISARQRHYADHEEKTSGKQHFSEFFCDKDGNLILRDKDGEVVVLSSDDEDVVDNSEGNCGK